MAIVFQPIGGKNLMFGKYTAIRFQNRAFRWHFGREYVADVARRDASPYQSLRGVPEGLRKSSSAMALKYCTFHASTAMRSPA